MTNRKTGRMDFLSRQTTHDLKNIFATLIANAELLAARRHDPKDEDRIKRILAICEKGVSLVEEVQQNNTTPSCIEPADTGHILLVEDEQILLELESRILRGHGYQVTTCLSTGEAFAFFLKEPQSIDIVLTNQGMPGKTGIQLIKEMQSIRPDISCILVTGDGRFLSDEVHLPDGCTLLNKPVYRTDLLNVIRENLAA